MKATVLQRRSNNHIYVSGVFPFNVMQILLTWTRYNPKDYFALALAIEPVFLYMHRQKKLETLSLI